MEWGTGSDDIPNTRFGERSERIPANRRLNWEQGNLAAMRRHHETSVSQGIHSDNAIERDREKIQARPREICIERGELAGAAAGAGFSGVRWDSD
jgi:hypothetical protein